MKRFSCLCVVLLSILFFSCGIKQLDDNIYGSIGLKLSSKVTNQILGNLADEDSGYDKIDVKVEVSGDFADSQIQTVQMAEEIEPVKFVFEKIPAKSVVTVTCTISISGTDTVLYEGKSEAFTILANEVQNVKITLHPADIGVEELEPTVEIELPEIEIVFNADVKSYSLIKVFDEIFLADKSVENYNKYSVCKSYAVSDELIQFVINNWDSSYAVKLNKTELKVTEDGKLELAEVVKNLAAGKNTVAIVKDEEVIDSVEFPVENGIYDCQEPVLKVNDLVIKGGDKIRYGIKAGVSEKVNLTVVQADGTEFDKRVETTYDMSGESFTVEDDTIVLPGKAKNTYEVKFAVKVPEEYRDPNGTYEAAASFTTSYDVDTGYVALDETSPDLRTLYYSENGDGSFKLIETLNTTNLDYCFDEYGNVYYKSDDDFVVNQYSVSKKVSSEVYNSISESKTKLSYDYDNSLLYISAWAYEEYTDVLYRIDTTTNNCVRYSFGGEIIGARNDSFVAIKDEYLYCASIGNEEYTLKKCSMTFDDTTNTVLCSDPKVYIFPDTIGTSYLKMNDMVMVGDDIYFAMMSTASRSLETEDNKNFTWEERGCVLKFNTKDGIFSILGLMSKPEQMTACLPLWCQYYGGGSIEYIKCSIENPYETNTSAMYTDEECTTQCKLPMIIKSYTPGKDETKNFREVTHFVAIKPKKLLASETGMFFYSDEGLLRMKSTGAFVTVDLENFAIIGSQENSIVDMYREISAITSASFTGIKPFSEETDLYYKYVCNSPEIKPVRYTDTTEFDYKIPNESYNSEE